MDKRVVHSSSVDSSVFVFSTVEEIEDSEMGAIVHKDGCLLILPASLQGMRRYHFFTTDISILSINFLVSSDSPSTDLIH